MGIDLISPGWMHSLVIALSAFGAAIAALALMTWTWSAGFTRQGLLVSDKPETTAFLFDDTDMVDATGTARALLASVREEEDSWQRLLAYVTPRFPAFEEHVAKLSDLGRFTLISEGPRPVTLCAEWRGGLTRITLSDPRSDTVGGALDPISQRALEDELAGLRATMERAPFLVWRETAQGAVIWANRSYLALATRQDEDQGWPLPRLFPELDLPDLPAAGAEAATPRRASIRQRESDQLLWFECYGLRTETGRLVFALPADAAVEAESSLRGFIQTLTKTFAHLTVGLAIFDRGRQLALFNPALIELTRLSPEFLSARPTLPAFLDAMREKRTIPEPKDYKGWRDRLAQLEKAAAAGHYEETWTLPSGRTYQVTGRPHPDGAVAFLFDDISAELSQTRRYRAELELSQSVIDSMEEAIAVFSPAGEMILSNAAYAKLWQTEAGQRPASRSLQEALRLWQSRCAPSPIWARLRLFADAMDERESWSSEVRLSDGRALRCRFSAAAGGATMAQFALLATPARDAAARGGDTTGRAGSGSDGSGKAKRKRQA